MEWTEDAIAHLRALWQDGLSTAEIGRRMGITKNAVVGKAHRLDLPARPSPIRREVVRRAGGNQPEDGNAATRGGAAAAAAPAPPERGRPLRAASAWTGRVSPCCWPIGEPGTRAFRFCDDETLPNKPYCPAHAQLAYVRLKDRRDTAA